MQNITFLFSGQGVQCPGMGKELYDNSSAAKLVFDTADNVLGRRISELCFYGTQDELNLTHNTQPCVLAADLAAYAAITEQGIRPQAVAGFSLGEYAALVAAKVISIEDAFRLVQIRAEAMQDAVPVGRGAMAAVMGISPQEVEKMCDEVDGYVVPANYNSPVQCVVSGESRAVKAILKLAKKREIRAAQLFISIPSHCKLMEPARVTLEQAFQKVRFDNAIIPIYMNVDGKQHTQAEDIKQCMLQQIVESVYWIDIVKNISSDIGSVFIELGISDVLCNFIRKINPDAQVAQVEDTDTLQDVITMLA